MENSEKIKQETDEELKKVLENGDDEETRKFIKGEILEKDEFYKEVSEEEKKKMVERHLQMLKNSSKRE